MDGYTAATKIRRMEKNHQPQSSAPIPIIALTAHALKGVREKCIAAGMNDCLVKPLWRRKLLGTVERWLEPKPDTCFNQEREPSPDDLDMGSALPPINMERALEEFMGQKSVLANVLEGFVKTVHRQIKTIHRALEADDTETVRKHAHAIKGGAANLTAQPLSSAAMAMEMTAKSGLLDNGIDRLASLKKELIRLESHITPFA